MKGKLTVTVIEVKELKDVQLLGKMDPFVRLECGKEKHKTSVKNGAGRQATYNESFIFNLEGKEDKLHVYVIDKELISDDDIGRTDIPLQTLASTTAGTWYQLVETGNFKKIAGQVCLQATFVGTGGPASADPAPAKQAAQAPVQAAAAPAAAAAAPQMVMQQPQVIYAAPQYAAPQQQQQIIYAPQQQAQAQLVRGTDGKLYAIAPQPQPQVVYVQAPPGAQIVQQPRFM